METLPPPARSLMFGWDGVHLVLLLVLDVVWRKQPSMLRLIQGSPCCDVSQLSLHFTRPLVVMLYLCSQLYNFRFQTRRLSHQQPHLSLDPTKSWRQCTIDFSYDRICFR